MNPNELERLAMLAEECGEVIQIIGKILRFGYDSSHPVTGIKNRVLLRNELTDIFGVVEMMEIESDIDGISYDSIQEAIGRKRKYSSHQ